LFIVDKLFRLFLVVILGLFTQTRRSISFCSKLRRKEIKDQYILLFFDRIISIFSISLLSVYYLILFISIF